MAEDATQLQGLSDGEAARRLSTEGYNELPRANQRTLLRIAIEVLREPMFQLLIAAATLYLMLGSHGEALLLLASAAFTISIAIIQESRAEHVLEALRDLSSPRALVIRDGQRRRIPGREVARGDLVVIAEGDRVPADAELLSVADLQVDESLLTGESVPVRKVAGVAGPMSFRPGGDNIPVIFSGSLVVHGHGLSRVTATGIRSEIGKIGKALREINVEPTLIHRQTRRLVRIFATVGLILSVLLTILYGVLRHDWMGGLLAGITMAMAMLPEEFPLVLTVFLVLGAWRLAQQRVLTRRSATIETLGAATVLCTDKTGTLTQNRMTIAEFRKGADMHIASASEALPAHFHELLESGILASERSPFDPMEKAFQEQGHQHLPDTLKSHGAWTLLHRYGLTPQLLAVVHVWATDVDETRIVAAKGAPEAIADLCHLGAQELEEVRRMADDMAARGMRVLGVARAPHAGDGRPDSPHDFEFVFLGLVGLADPLRDSVPAAIRECRTAGIRVVMITGDYPTTARAIAAQAGLDVSAGVITGEALAGMSDAELQERLRTATVFARIMPEQKLRIVQALKANGEVVAMTGDGVNDAPSLQAAHIGIAMGGRGTDVAREAASMVLLDDDFGSIVNAVRQGRRIYDNLLKAMGYILAVHVPIAGLSLLPLLLGWPLLFTPIHIAFLELIIDPVCSIVFENEHEEADVMQRRPRNPSTPLFSRFMVLWSISQGAAVLVLILVLYGVALGRGMPEDEARALTFAALVATNFGLIFVNRAFDSSIVEALRRRNAALLAVMSATAALLGIALYLPAAKSLFHFGQLHLDDLSVVLLVGLLTLTLLEWTKRGLRALHPLHP